jgi:hypothetical protein
VQCFAIVAVIETSARGNQRFELTQGNAPAPLIGGRAQ